MTVDMTVPEHMVEVLDLAAHGRLPYPNADSEFFPDDPGMEGVAQVACGLGWIVLVEGDGDPYVLLHPDGRDALDRLRQELAGGRS